MDGTKSSSGALLLADKFGKLRPPPKRRGGHFGHLKTPIGMAGRSLKAYNFFVSGRIFTKFGKKGV